jgi:hypothetical protein
LSFFDEVAFFNDDFERRADVLVDNDGVFVEQRGIHDGFGCGERFAVFRVDAAFKFAGFIAHFETPS